MRGLVCTPGRNRVERFSFQVPFCSFIMAELGPLFGVFHPPAPLSREQYWVLAMCCAASLVNNLDLCVFTLALPQLQKSLGIDE